MKPELFEKLEKLKRDFHFMDFAAKAKFITELKARLPVEALSTTTGRAFSEDVLLSVGMTSAVTSRQDDFERALGLYGAGYRSRLREAVLSGKLEMSNNEWRHEIRRLRHFLRASETDDAMEASWQESKF